MVRAPSSVVLQGGCPRGEVLTSGLCDFGSPWVCWWLRHVRCTWRWMCTVRRSGLWERGSVRRHGALVPVAGVVLVLVVARVRAFSEGVRRVANGFGGVGGTVPVPRPRRARGAGPGACFWSPLAVLRRAERAHTRDDHRRFNRVTFRSETFI